MTIIQFAGYHTIPSYVSIHTYTLVIPINATSESVEFLLGPTIRFLCFPLSATNIVDLFSERLQPTPASYFF